jgi:hypothetical protein
MFSDVSEAREGRKIVPLLTDENMSSEPMDKREGLRPSPLALGAPRQPLPDLKPVPPPLAPEHKITRRPVKRPLKGAVHTADDDNPDEKPESPPPEGKRAVDWSVDGTAVKPKPQTGVGAAVPGRNVRLPPPPKVVPGFGLKRGGMRRPPVKPGDGEDFDDVTKPDPE